MFIKEKRRALRRWRSFHAWMRRLQNDWWTHGSRLNPRGVYLHMKETGVCSIKRGDNWRDRYFCDCFDFGLQGSYRFKDTPHPVCGYECKPEKYSHGLESRPIQEWREEARAWGDEAPVDFRVRRREPEKMVLIRKKCLCGYLLDKEWKRVQDVRWSDRLSNGDRCPDCKRHFEERMKMPA